MYALYSKNKPQSDALLSSHGNEFFKVRSGTSHNVSNAKISKYKMPPHRSPLTPPHKTLQIFVAVDNSD